MWKVLSLARALRVEEEEQEEVVVVDHLHEDEDGRGRLGAECGRMTTGRV